MPSPKSGKAVSAIKPKAPGAAAAADNAKSGNVTAVSTKAAKKHTGKFAPVQVAPIVPPPKNSPPKQKSDKPCGVAGMSLECEHKPHGKPRKADPVSGTLQVVPKAEENDKQKYGFADILEVEIHKGGRDKLTVKIFSLDGQPVGRKQSCLKLSSLAPKESDWESGASKTYTVEAPANHQKWPSDFNPLTRYVYGRGCDDTILSHAVEIFPSQQYKVTIDGAKIKAWHEDLKEGVLGLILKALDGEEESHFKFFQGKLEISWGWQEDDNWRAYFAVKVIGKVDPVFGWEHEYQLSIAKWLLVALTGTPPVFAELATKYIADIYISFKPGLKLSLSAGVTRKRYSNAEVVWAGNPPELELAGELEVALAARLGSESIAGIIVSGGGSTGIKGTGEFEWDEGLVIKPKAKWDGLTLFVRIEFKAFQKSMYKDENNWEVFPPSDEKEFAPHRLLP